MIFFNSMEKLENKGFAYEFGSSFLTRKRKLYFLTALRCIFRPRNFETLLLLVENNGKALTKDEMMAVIWQDSFVEESNLAIDLPPKKNPQYQRRAVCRNPAEARLPLLG